LIGKPFKWKLSNSGKPKSHNLNLVYRYGNPEPSPENLKFEMKISQTKDYGKVQRLDGSYPNVKTRVKRESNSQNLELLEQLSSSENCKRMKIR
jgi:hypothetical protein